MERDAQERNEELNSCTPFRPAPARDSPGGARTNPAKKSRDNSTFGHALRGVRIVLVIVQVAGDERPQPCESLAFARGNLFSSMGSYRTNNVP